MRLLFFVIALLLPYLALSQHFDVSGKILDEDNQPIAFANVILQTEDTSQIIKGTTTNSTGNFKFTSLKSCSCVLKVSFLGFESYQKQLKVNKHLYLDDIILKEKTESLDGVVVTAKRPVVKRLVDRLVFNVENSTLSNTNVLDVLKHTPGVIVRDNEISVKNTTPVVYINDRRVYLSIEEVQQLLQATPASNIKSIEVITNPPAKYDAEGGAVLNIVTSKNIIAGYHGSVFGNYQQGFQFPKFSVGTSHFFKTKKLDAYVSYNINPRKDYRNNLEAINFIENDAITSSWATDFKRERQSANQNITGTINYDFDTRNSLNFTTNMLVAPRDNSKTRVNSLTEVFGADRVLDSTFRTFNNLVSEKLNLAFSLGYIHKFKTEGEQLSVDLHHTNYDFSEFQNVDTGYFLPDATTSFRDNQFQTFSNQAIQLTSGQIDYKLPMTDDAVFEAGAKTVSINSDNILDQFLFNNGLKEEDFNNSDLFNYKETNYAGYASYEKDWDKWSLKAGLRVEHTATEGVSQLLNTTTTNNYTNIFPTFHILNRLNNDDEVYFSYNRRIYRPRYRDLNPFRYFLNDNTYSTGDPNLLPQIDDMLILGYTFKDVYTLELYYRNEKNPTLEFIFQDNLNNNLIYRRTNTDVSFSFGFDFNTYQQLLPNWNLNILTSFFYYKNKFVSIENNNNVFSTNRWTIYADIINSFSILKDKSLQADVSYSIISPTVEGPNEASSIASLNLNLRKLFFDNRAYLSIGIIDIFNTQNFDIRTKYSNQDSFISLIRENRMFVLGFNYKFGNLNLKKNKNDEIDSEERSRINKI
ncbi:outer membrane beta-barrel family protein [Flavobacteriaceae bacterium MHTCC 0001]